MITRRSLITGTTALLAAPAIVRAESIMPVRPLAGLVVGPDMTAREVEMRWDETYADVYRRANLGEIARAYEDLSRHMTNWVLRIDGAPEFKKKLMDAAGQKI